MLNLELAQIFNRMADLFEMEEEFFKSRAYSKVARLLESMEKDVFDIYREEGMAGLEKISGIGKGIAKKIEEYIKIGRIAEYDKLKKESPVDIESLLSVEGLGPRKIKLLYKKLGVKNLKDLGKAAKNKKIRDLDGFGAKTEKNILEGIAFVKASKGRFLLGEILPVVREIVLRMKKLSCIDQINYAGSVRRMKETIGDIDILVSSNNQAKVNEYFTQMPEVIKVWARGPTKSSIRLRGGFDCDLRIIKKESFGAALQYFTGSKDHNILVRRLAIKKRLKLNEYGVFNSGGRIAGRNEEEVYKALSLPYIEPELRENRGEIEAGLGGKLPQLIDYNDIKGETQCHTDWSDGRETIEQMAKAAKKMGYKYIAITDHAGFLRIANGMDGKQLLKQMDEIDGVNKKVSGIKILKGAEVDIKMDGTLAIEDKVLSKLDVVLVSVHSGFKMGKEDMTKRIARALENKYVNILGHPTGRVIFKREGYQINLEKIIKTAKKNKVALEINAHLDRLDLKDTDVCLAIEKGAKLTIGTDAHFTLHLPMMELGIAQARRGWARKDDILNTRSLTDFLKYFKEK